MTEIWMRGGGRAEVGHLIHSGVGVTKSHLPEEVLTSAEWKCICQVMTRKIEVKGTVVWIWQFREQQLIQKVKNVWWGVVGGEAEDVGLDWVTKHL